MITLANLSEATEQEVFDQVARHLLTQKVQSKNINNKCLYRSGNFKCAAGCLMTDEEFEELPADSNTVGWATLKNSGLVSNNCFTLILALQKAHDHNNPNLWPDVLKGITLRFNLSDLVLEEFTQ